MLEVSVAIEAEYLVTAVVIVLRLRRVENEIVAGLGGAAGPASEQSVQFENDDMEACPRRADEFTDVIFFRLCRSFQ